MYPRKPAVIPFALAAAILVSPTEGQVPEGSAAVGTYHDPSNAASTGAHGLFLIDLATKAVTRISGVPKAILARPNHGHGIWSVAVRSSDGAIALGTVTRGAVELYLLHLKGTAVAKSEKLVLGQSPSVLGAARVVVLPDDQLYVTGGTNNVALAAPGAMAGAFHAIVDTSRTPWQVTKLTNALRPNWGKTGGIVLDPTGKRLYMLHSASYWGANGWAELQALDLTTRKMCRLARWPNEAAFGLAVDDDGTVYAASNLVAQSWEHRIHAVQPNGCATPTITTTRSSRIVAAWGMALDRRSGRFVVSSFGHSALPDQKLNNSVSWIEPKTGAVTVITNGRTGGWGLFGMQAVAVNNAIESYGAPSDGNNRYWFANFPNPGGQPSVGNGKFSLTVRSAPRIPLMSAIALSAGRGRTPVFGAEVLVDLRTALVVGVPSSRVLPLPIPNNASFRGAAVTAQSVHFETAATRMFASRGLTFTIQ